MKSCTRWIALVVLSALVLPCLAIQNSADTDTFVVSVASPTQVKDVQMRVFFTGDFGGFGTSTAVPQEGKNIVVKTAVEAKPAKTFRAIAYAPGCQFVTISDDNLAASSRQAEFKCTPLAKTTLHGSFPIAAYEAKDLQVEVLYDCGWAHTFFNIADGAVSPFSLGKTSVTADGTTGTFSLEIPDFPKDPLWSSLSSNAGLMFVLIDRNTGNRLPLIGADSDSQRHHLKLASGYPDVINFTIQQ